MKIIYINKCRNCPYLDFGIIGVYCLQKPGFNLSTDKLNEIPVWCPLTDAPLKTFDKEEVGK